MWCVVNVPPFVMTETIKEQAKAYPAWLDFREGRVVFGLQGVNTDVFNDIGWIYLAIFDAPRTGLEIVISEPIR